MPGSVYTEQQITAYITRWDHQSRAAVNRWLEVTDYNEAADILARILQKQTPEKLQSYLTVMWVLVAVFLTIFFLTYLLPLLLNGKSGGGPGIISMLPIFFAVYGQRFTIAPRAALLLARLNDQRAVAGLADTWLPNARVNSTYAKEQSEFAPNLVRLLDGLSGPSVIAAPETRASLRRLLKRLVPFKRTPRKDLTEEVADVLIAALRVLSRTGANEDKELLARIADANVIAKQSTPNRDLVREAARLCLASPAGVDVSQTAIAALGNATTSGSAIPQVQQVRRS